MSGVRVNARDLRLALKVATAFTALGDGWDSGLDRVCVQTAGGFLTATATNRFVLGRYRVPADGDLGGMFLLLSPDQVKMTRILLGYAERSEQATLSHNGESVRLELPEFAWRLPNMEGATVVQRWLGVSADKLFERADSNAEPVGVISIDPRWAARFAKVPRRIDSQPIWRFAAPPSPTRVDIGVHFSGLVMPIRLNPEVKS